MEDACTHENAHHSRRKATQPIKQSHRVMQFVETQLVKMSNDNLRDKDAGVDVSTPYCLSRCFYFHYRSFRTHPF